LFSSYEINALYIIVLGFIIAPFGGKEVRKGEELLEIKFTGQLDKMTPNEFEILIDDMYPKMGYKCENLQSSRDSGADVIAIKDGIKYIIQAKHYNVNNTVRFRYDSGCLWLN